MLNLFDNFLMSLRSLNDFLMTFVLFGYGFQLLKNVFNFKIN